MKNLLRLEELVQFLFCLSGLLISDVPWWVYVLLAIGPDIGILGYAVNTKVGSIAYNFLHHKGLALLLVVGGWYLNLMNVLDQGHLPNWGVLTIVGLILYGHASLDRIFGYGLKFGDSFQHTHLGWIGKGSPSGMQNDQ
ncbi:MAG: DUF4260 domain-containing protein [Flavobacteriales bacterium]